MKSKTGSSREAGTSAMIGSPAVSNWPDAPNRMQPQVSEKPNGATSQRQWPCVGVLIAVYAKDVPHLFRAALDSILGQIYPQAKCRIYLGVDGPLGPELQHVIEEYRDKFFCVSASDENLGLAATLNRLISTLSGEVTYVFRMDADDISHRERFVKQVEFMQANPQVDLCGTDIEEVDLDDGSRLTRTFPRTHEEVMSYLCKAPPFAHPSVCFRRSFFDRFGTYPQVSACQDVALWYRAAWQGAVFANLDQALLRLTKNREFYKRRSIRRAWLEFSIHTKGIYRAHGLTYRMVWPISRLCIRLMPAWVIRKLYSGKLRRRLFNVKA